MSKLKKILYILIFLFAVLSIYAIHEVQGYYVGQTGINVTYNQLCYANDRCGRFHCQQVGQASLCGQGSHYFKVTSIQNIGNSSVVSGGQASIRDNTGKVTWTTDTSTRDKVGPYNVTFAGSVSAITIKTDKGNFANGSGGVSVSNITSGGNFYIYVNRNSGITKVNGITIKVERSQVVRSQRQVNLACYEVGSSHGRKGCSTAAGVQHLATFDTGETTTTTTATVDIPKGAVGLMDLGGKVFEDIFTGKQNQANGYYDSQDKPVRGVEVALIRADTNKIVATATTDASGKYLFKDQLRAYTYYVRFKYDGQNYEPTTYNRGGSSSVPSIETRSYATDGTTNRHNFNNVYAEITGKVDKTRNLYAYTGSNGTQALKKYSGNTSEKERLNINFGMMKREQVDFAVRKDLKTAKIMINGKEQTYQYNSRLKEDWVLNLKGSSLPNYERAIRKEDIEFTRSSNPQDEIKVYVTYTIRVINQSAGQIEMALTGLVDYYDEDYIYDEKDPNIKTERTIAGNTKNKEKITWSQQGTVTDTTTGKKYKKMTAKMQEKSNHSDAVKSGSEIDFDVTFQVKPEAIKSLLTKKESTKHNFTEITGYTTRYAATKKDLNGNVRSTQHEVAGLIDRDSIPGNMNISKKNYEDDADTAPGLKLVLEENNTRKLDGNVWEDRTQVKDLVRLGDGLRQTDKNAKEDLIEGVKVELIEIKTNETVAETKTNQDGAYHIERYIPGDYKLRFTYGNGDTVEKYSGQDYKSTLYDSKKHNENEYWYTNEEDISDAKDDMTRREEVNSYSKEIINDKAKILNKQKDKEQLVEKTQMYAQTNKMNMEVEFARTETKYKQDCTYEVKKVDFGIAERPRSELTIEKTVSHLKILTSDGQTLFDANQTAPNLSWTDQNITANMDENLLHGSTIELTYDITISNTGEKDYVVEQQEKKVLDEAFYDTGIPSKNAQLTTSRAAYVIDYINNNMMFDPERNSDWEVVDTKELQQGSKDNPNNQSLVDDTIESVPLVNTIIKAKQNNPLLKELTVEKGHNKEHSQVVLSKVISGQNDEDDLTYDNQVEIIKVENDAGRRNYNEVVSIPGNLDPDTTQDIGLEEPDASRAQTVVILPPFGENKISIIWYTIGAILIGVVGVTGIVIIKKKVLGS